MKKIFSFLAVALFSLALASCTYLGNKEAQADVDSTAVDTTAVQDTIISVDTTAVLQ